MEEEEKGVSGSITVISEENTGSLYPIIFGVSCAFFALRLLPAPEICDKKWSAIRNRVVNGSALVGLLVWTVERNVVTTEKFDLLQKLDKAEMEISELKKRRSEDAKANEKVVSIFAGREQEWFDERRKLRHQISSLMNELRVLEANKEKSVGELGEKMKEIEVILQLKDKMIEEAERRRVEAEAKLKAAEDVAAELRQNMKSEAERHSSEISKHKTAFIELVSNQRQLEAEMGRTLRQVEAAKHEVDAVLEQKEKMALVNQRLSMEMVRMHKDLEQKDHILSAMLRKSRAEKQMLLKEVKSSKAKRKQAELETARWKAISDSKHSFTSMFSKYKHAEMNKKGVEFLSFVSDPYLPDGTEELTEAIGVEQKRHHVEIDAFMEQLRQKEEKLEAYNWRVMNTEMESKRLQAHIESLDRDIARLKHDNMRLEGVLMDREAKLESLQGQLMMHFLPHNSDAAAAISNDTVCSRVKLSCRRQEMKEEKDIVISLQPANKEIKEDECGEERKVSEEGSNSTWKVDVHALGVVYKIKRLRQQLFLVERLKAKDGVKGLDALMSMMNRQVDRYHSLQGKIDDLCTRMQEKSSCGGWETKRMEQFLEETFQVQRYIVSTGQKLMEVKAKIGDAEEGVERFAESLTTLFRETQRGLEVRISRIIGDLEGSLARDGFRRL